MPLMSRSKLAAAAGLGQAQNVYRYERGIRSPDADELMRIADVLGVSLDHLVRGTPMKRKRARRAA